MILASQSCRVDHILFRNGMSSKRYENIWFDKFCCVEIQGNQRDPYINLGAL